MRITIDNVKESLGVTSTWDIVNAIRNSNPNVAHYTPLANAENVAEIGAGLNLHQATLNEFVQSLVDRIALVVIRSVSLSNPLGKFKKGNIPLGKTIEEVFVDLAKEQRYDPEDAETTVFRQTMPNVKSLFHERNRQSFYPYTVRDESLQSAFISWGDFERFVSQIINSIYNSAEVDEYKYMMLLVDNYYAKGQFKVVPIEDPRSSSVAASEFIKKARSTFRRMTLPQGSRDYNALAVHTRSNPEDMHLLIDADLEAEVDVDVLAKAFNIDRSNFLGQVTVIDGFASEGLQAVLMDKEIYMVYDNLLKLETIRNPKGLYWNGFYHVWQTLSMSRFANAVAFVTGEVDPVTQVIVTPAIANIKQGRTLDLTAYVRKTDESYEPEIKWSVESNVGGALTGTTLQGEGTKAVLQVGPDETNELKITATVTIETEGEDEEGAPTTIEKDIVGEAIIVVAPELD